MGLLYSHLLKISIACYLVVFDRRGGGGGGVGVRSHFVPLLALSSPGFPLNILRFS